MSESKYYIIDKYNNSYVTDYINVLDLSEYHSLTMVINLTDLFGKGNEPSKDIFDVAINKFIEDNIDNYH